MQEWAHLSLEHLAQATASAPERRLIQATHGFDERAVAQARRPRASAGQGKG